MKVHCKIRHTGFSLWLTVNGLSMWRLLDNNGVLSFSLLSICVWERERGQGILRNNKIREQIVLATNVLFHLFPLQVNQITKCKPARTWSKFYCNFHFDLMFNLSNDSFELASILFLKFLKHYHQPLHPATHLPKTWHVHTKMWVCKHLHVVNHAT